MKSYTHTDATNQVHHYQIQKLTGKEVMHTRPLWEEVFSEDSPSFTDYYFSHKAAQNITFVCKYEDKIVSMIHMTPYDMQLQEKVIPTFYIVGVATKEEHRHRGLMATLLQEVFIYAKEVKAPFVFLMPADPAIYRPFGFSYIYERPEYEIPSGLSMSEVYINSFIDSGLSMNFIDSTQDEYLLCKLSAFASKTLKKQYDYYILHTPNYFRTLLLELKSQNGGIFYLTKDRDIVGYFLYAAEGKPFIQEMLLSLDSDIFNNCIMLTGIPIEKKETKPIIMAKNICDDNSVFIDYVNLLSNLKGCINEIV
ncbi:MAG: GNAT family N-acetyltransferase [Lachnospiraceae bacterium]|nr:GNAT family N-acetyltransferase [Lachnospiraceae bacterium]